MPASSANFSWKRSFYLGFVVLTLSVPAMARLPTTTISTGLGEIGSERISIEDGAKLTRTTRPAAGRYDALKLVEFLDREVPAIMRAAKIKGAAIGLIVDGQLLTARGFGFADHDGQVPVTPDTVFLAASLAKPVAAAAVLVLAEEGKLMPDEPVSEVLKPWPLPSSSHDHSKITLRQLLSHTAGLSLHGYRGWSGHQELPTLLESVQGKTNGAGKVELVDAPGRRWRYSGGGYTLMQLATEQLVKDKFERVAEKKVFSPLAMSRSSLSLTDNVVSQSAQGHGDRGEAIPMRYYLENAASALTTTVKDFAKFMIAGMQSDPADAATTSHATARFSATVRQAMQMPVPVTLGVLRGYLGYGLGLYIRRLPDGSIAVEHDGRNQAGFRAMFAYRPAERDGIVFLSNSRTGLALDRIVCLWRETVSVSNQPCASE
jgi:CubicO group peptidase (beta-lactamase class C family)